MVRKRTSTQNHAAKMIIGAVGTYALNLWSKTSHMGGTYVVHSTDKRKHIKQKLPRTPFRTVCMFLLVCHPHVCDVVLHRFRIPPNLILPKKILLG